MASTTTGMLMKKIACQEKWSIRMPQSTGLPTRPSRVTEVHAAIALRRSSSSKTTMRMDSVDGMISAPPTPIATRTPIISPGLATKTAASDAAPNRSRPMIMTFRRPNRSPRLPEVSSSPAKTRTYESRIHWVSWAVAPMSLVIWGTATVSAMPSTTRTSELRHSTTRIHQRCELRVSIRVPSGLRTLFLRCEHCTHKRTLCASLIVMYAECERRTHGRSVMAAKPNPAPSVWTRPREPEQPALSRAAIVREAITMLDADGIEALSMRKLGAALNAGATSLYRHVATKDELMELAVDEVVAEITVPPARQPRLARRRRRDRPVVPRDSAAAPVAGFGPRPGGPGLPGPQPDVPVRAAGRAVHHGRLPRPERRDRRRALLRHRHEHDRGGLAHHRRPLGRDRGRASSPG